MSACCSHDAHDDGQAELSGAFRRVVWLALVLNFAMFAVEIAAGFYAGSVALWSDALDFFSDGANFAITLAVLGMAARPRALAAMLKGVSMAAFGLWILAAIAANALSGGVPSAPVMGGVATVALAVNLSVALMLYRFRNGDANRRSLWLCTRNDALGNLAVLAAASGVFATSANWPDLLVAFAMAMLALHSAVQVIRQSLGELRPSTQPAS
jgi:cation diffusion facilitator family transporter